MKRTTKIALGASLTAGLAIGGVTIAQAGHLNDVLEADLDGRNEVASDASDKRILGDPNGTGEAYVFGIDETTNKLCYILLAEGIDELDLAPGNGRAAHIHKGGEGTNGPVVINIAWPQGGEAGDCVDAATQPARFTVNGVTPELPARQAIVADVLAHPEDYYVNVHNNEYPSGAVRGQLQPVD